MAPTIEMTTTWERTCELEDLEPGWGEVALLGARQVALVRVGGDEVYDLGTGACFTDASLALRTYRTRVVGGMIEVELDD